MRPIWCACVLLLAASAPAAAQMNKEPLPAVVFDARVAIPLMGQDGVTAGGLGVDPTLLPSVGKGLALGVHTYVLRRGSFSIGLGGEFVRASASTVLTDATGTATGTEIDRTFQTVTGQVSFNFGHRLGWSYVTGGAGPLTFDSHFKGVSTTSTRTNAINYGGGARWFVTPSLAFTFDMRFYRPGPSPVTATSTGRSGHKVTVFAVGLSFR